MNSKHKKIIILTAFLYLSACSGPAAEPRCEYKAEGPETDKAYNACMLDWAKGYEALSEQEKDHYSRESAEGIIKTCERTAYWQTRQLDCSGSK